MTRQLLVPDRRSRVTGRMITLPVEYTRTGGQVVILAGRGDTKTWWRNVIAPRQVEVWLDGRWHRGTATALLTDHPDRSAALAAYRSTHPRVPIDTDDPIVTVTLDTKPHPNTRSRSPWLSWFWSVTLGECLGFTAPAVVGAGAATLAWAIGSPPAPLALTSRLATCRPHRGGLFLLRILSSTETLHRRRDNQ